MNTIILGDVHGCFDGLAYTLAKAGAIDNKGDKNPNWRIVQVGDLANMAPLGQEYRGFLSEDFETVAHFGPMIDDLIVGNHEVYFTHGLMIGHWSGMGKQEAGDFDPELIPLMKRLAFEGKYKAAAEVDGMLVTHAGLHRDWLTHMGCKGENAFVVANLLNELLIDSAQGNVPLRMSGQANDPINSPNGVFWLRPMPWGEWNYGHGTEFTQVCGHTPQRKHPKFYDHLNAWIVDSGGYMNKEHPHIPALVKYEDEDEYHVLKQDIPGEIY